MKKLMPAPQTGLHGTVTVPGDKSISHRAVMLGSISTGTTVINHFLFSEDCLSTVKAFQNLGVEIDLTEDQVVVHGVGFKGLKKPQNYLQMGNSGTTTRLIMGLLSGQDFTTQLIGDDSLSRRPMKRVSEPLSLMGANIQTTSGHLPVSIMGQDLHAIKYQMTVASAQVKSAIILAASQADGPSEIKELLPTRNHTETMLNAFGGQIKTSDDQLTIQVTPKPKLSGITLTVPGDISSAAFFIAAALLVPNSEVRLQKVGINDTRSGILKVLQRMGAQIALDHQNYEGEPFADMVIKTSELSATDIQRDEIPSLVDELPIIALVCARAKGISTISGAQELRVKETDRIAAIVQEFQKLGIQIVERPDGFTITGSNNWQPVETHLDSHGDHRIGMTLAVAGLLTNQSLTLSGEESVSISYPNFFDDLASLL
ncbi:3-phosphoshikimate 1-carboxyvinyltransferase [Lentilactobacillus sp. SPB1-3]|uniref:3-phosphoshikimate 1-carboxyvinyltransferase n=1 Tax=Lentilactobacillus terminaliae TaxID=3003483 RepID=A0ACD5DDV7_9LACO|nr:3-phosphoshikimate 1-carboxyvinyltransferase [Lentilactobacillus sp. SPB1-3]MCZ0977776.1 3-phosphoshikimate 1-carboxyvinyltransferase [Lentilactobacillus sp. SPB1-3]